MINSNQSTIATVTREASSVTGFIAGMTNFVQLTLKRMLAVVLEAQKFAVTVWLLGRNFRSEKMAVAPRFCNKEFVTYF